jgi:hypothetical protein
MVLSFDVDAARGRSARSRASHRRRWGPTPRTVACALGLTGLLVGCTSNGGDSEATPRVGTADGPAVSVSLRADEAGSVLSALERSGLGYSASGSGDRAFVTGIGGRSATEAEFWALHVNGEAATIGAGARQVVPGDVVEWHLESIR